MSRSRDARDRPRTRRDARVPSGCAARREGGRGRALGPPPPLGDHEIREERDPPERGRGRDERASARRGGKGGGRRELGERCVAAAVRPSLAPADPRRLVAAAAAAARESAPNSEWPGLSEPAPVTEARAYDAATARADALSQAAAS